jgi:hypothetical protein
LVSRTSGLDGSEQRERELCVIVKAKSWLRKKERGPEQFCFFPSTLEVVVEAFQVRETPQTYSTDRETKIRRQQLQHCMPVKANLRPKVEIKEKFDSENKLER